MEISESKSEKRIARKEQIYLEFLIEFEKSRRGPVSRYVPRSKLIQERR